MEQTSSKEIFDRTTNHLNSAYGLAMELAERKAIEPKMAYRIADILDEINGLGSRSSTRKISLDAMGGHHG